MIDQVALFDSQFRQVFINASPMRGDAREAARIMEHPLESGQVVSDYKVMLPIEISIPLIISGRFYWDVYQEIKTLFQKSELLSVQLRAETYGDMVIVQMPHEERADMHDAITVNLMLKQVVFVKKPDNYSPKDESMSDTAENGEQLPEEYSGEASDEERIEAIGRGEPLPNSPSVPGSDEASIEAIGRGEGSLGSPSVPGSDEARIEAIGLGEQSAPVSYATGSEENRIQAIVAGMR